MNLNDALSSVQPRTRREFYVPLASVPPGWLSTRAVPVSRFASIDESYTTAGTGAGRVHSEVALQIIIGPGGGEPATEDGLPEPAIRLHAVGRGELRFLPASRQILDRLELKLTSSGLLPTSKAPWFQRWVEANCLPKTVMYENVDRVALRALLEATPAPETQPGSGQSMPSFFGVAFPDEVTQAKKAAFIERFLRGGDEAVSVAAGAYIGSAGAHIRGDPTMHRVILHAYYADHTATKPHPMNPRELFHLLFGDDSAEAQGHPLLRRIDQIGHEEQADQPESKRMLLRPPLRTWHRAMWEAEQEFAQHATSWARDAALGKSRFYNDATVGFEAGNYPGAWKCNLFVSDICLRAGFRIATFKLSSGKYHYLNADSYAYSAHIVSLADKKGDRVPIVGNVDHNRWAWNIENWLRSSVHHPPDQPSTLPAALNAAMQREGRCFILAGSDDGPDSGHMLLVDKVLNGTGSRTVTLTDTSQPDEQYPSQKQRGLATIPAKIFAASKFDVVHEDDFFAVDGAAESPYPRDDLRSHHVYYGRLHLIEMHPGGDPDTLQGLRDLNARHTYIPNARRGVRSAQLSKPAPRSIRSTTKRTSPVRFKRPKQVQP